MEDKKLLTTVATGIVAFGVAGTTTVKADSDMGAIAQVESKYPYVTDIRILNRR